MPKGNQTMRIFWRVSDVPGIGTIHTAHRNLSPHASTLGSVWLNGNAQHFACLKDGIYVPVASFPDGRTWVEQQLATTTTTTTTTTTKETA